MNEELEVYSNGLVLCSVCTNIEGFERIEEVVNQKNPTGTKKKWVVSARSFRSGNPFQEKSGCPCETKEGYKHYLMEC